VERDGSHGRFPIGYLSPDANHHGDYPYEHDDPSKDHTEEEKCPKAPDDAVSFRRRSAPAPYKRISRPHQVSVRAPGHPADGNYERTDHHRCQTLTDHAERQKSPPRQIERGTELVALHYAHLMASAKAYPDSRRKIASAGAPFLAPCLASCRTHSG
jgi:hypothetical protein